MSTNGDDRVTPDAVARMRGILELVPAFRSRADALALDDSLRAHGLDSLGLIQLIDAIEEQLDRELSDDDLADENFSTLRNLVLAFGSRTRQPH
jgi:acyl carrier protein